ncbi:PatB family C-S lyase [Chloroflexi bacterium TSY]|nr:PatB family C-S lyase [Chloroflexi bacterium TSY]
MTHKTIYNFDQIHERRHSDSAKWTRHDADVIPMWVADMDFKTPDPILSAMKERIDHGIFGYGSPPWTLREVMAERLHQQSAQQWHVEPAQVSFLPGLVSGLNLVCRAIGDPGMGVLVNTPVYMPFISAPINQGRTLQSAELSCTTVLENGQEHLHYEIDFDALEDAIQPETRLFILCNPHNPVGRAYNKAELIAIAELCLKYDLILCSDEIHCDLPLGESKHLSIAAFVPEIAAQTITLVAPSKTFNLPGLGLSAAIIQDPDLRQRVDRAAKGIIPHVNLLGYVAGLAAYTECHEWHQALLKYLTANRDFVVEYVDHHLPGVRTTVPEATYLAWLDCRNAGIEGDIHQFFLEQARVAFSDGPAFGAGGDGFVRMNFGCPRATLKEGVTRMREALVCYTSR